MAEKSPGHALNGGAGESRTRVQTPVEKAFYMLISLLVVGHGQEANQPTHDLAVWSFAAGTAYRGSIPLSFLSRRRSVVAEQPAQRGPNDGLITD